MDSTRNDKKIEDIPQKIRKSRIDKSHEAHIQRSESETANKLSSRLEYQTERRIDNTNQTMANDRYLLKRDDSLKWLFSFKESTDLLTAMKRMLK